MVWSVDIVPPLPGVEGLVPVVAFEIESSWRIRKHVKGDLLNILDAGAAVGVIVLAGTEARDESLVHFARALVDRPGPQIQIWAGRNRTDQVENGTHDQGRNDGSHRQVPDTVALVA